MNNNIIFTATCNGHKISIYGCPDAMWPFSVTNIVRDGNGHLVDLAAFRDYEGYPVERRFANKANAIRYARKCVENAKKSF